MLDQEKSKEQLLQELSEIRNKLDESEAARAKHEESRNSLNVPDECRQIVDRTSESIFVYQDGPIKFVNPACRKLTGYSEQEALAADAIVDFVHPDDREMVEQYYASRRQGATTPYEYPFRIVCKDRTVKWVEMKSSLIVWEGRPAALCLMTDITDRKLAEDALMASEENLRLKLSNLMSPEYKIEEDEFRNVIDGARIQSLMDDFYKLTDIGVTISDLKGNVIVVTGWQDICKKFHRVHPVTHRNCIESAIQLTADVKEWEYRRYKCKNNMWDIVTPIFMGGKRVGNLLLGQFLFDDEDLDLAVFSAQAEHYGFDKDEYLAALKRVPRWSRGKVDTVMTFYSKFASMVGQLSYSNLKLAKTLVDTKRSEEELERNEMFLNQVLENIPDMIFVKDAEMLSLVRLNRAGEDLLGCSRDDLLGKTDYDLFPRSQADLFTSKDKLALATGKLV
ncbi:MAG: PocR ligand-binding domain-containing protein, partial [Desulfomonilaceae bacterium]